MIYAEESKAMNRLMYPNPIIAGQRFIFETIYQSTMNARMVAIMLILGSLTTGCMGVIEDWPLEMDGPQPIVMVSLAFVST